MLFGLCERGLSGAAQAVYEIQFPRDAVVLYETAREVRTELHFRYMAGCLSHNPGTQRCGSFLLLLPVYLPSLLPFLLLLIRALRGSMYLESCIDKNIEHPSASVHHRASEVLCCSTCHTLLSRRRGVPFLGASQNVYRALELGRGE